MIELDARRSGFLLTCLSCIAIGADSEVESICYQSVNSTCEPAVGIEVVLFVVSAQVVKAIGSKDLEAPMLKMAVHYLPCARYS